MPNCISGLETALAEATQCRDGLADFVVTPEHHDLSFPERLLIKQQRAIMQALVAVLEKRLGRMQ